MSITIGAWIIPVTLTSIMLIFMFRPVRSSGMYNFSGIFRLLWLIPICIIWMIYMTLMLSLR